MGMGGSSRGVEAVRPSKLVAFVLSIAILADACVAQAQTALTGSTLTGTAGTPNAAVLSVQGVGGGTSLPVTASADPCTVAAKSSVALNTSAAATALLVAASTGKVIYVCGFVFTLSGTAPTVKFISGTQTTTACDTGAADRTGAMAATASVGGSATVFSAPTSNQLCIVTAGTTPSAQGVLTYVQQ